MIKVTKLDEVYLVLQANVKHVDFEQDIKDLNFIDDRFSHYAENFEYDYRFKTNQWDGVIRYLRKVDYGVYIFPIGLFKELIRLCESSDINLDIQFSVDDIYSNIEVDWNSPYLTLPPEFEKRDYQIEYVNDFFKFGRICIISPTGSGKSAIIYMIIINLIKNVFKNNEKILLVVPNVDLVTQMYNEFKLYGFSDIDDYVYLMGDGAPKLFEKQFIISTWQSLQHLPEKTFNIFTALFVDECHGVSSTAEKLTYISHNSINAKFRLGTTGTVPEKIADEMNMVAYLGQICKRTSTSQLIKQGYLSPLIIKSTVLVWKSKERYDADDFQNEYKAIVECEERKDLIINVCKKMISKTSGTILVLGKRVEYLKELADKLSNEISDDVFLVTGKHTVKKQRKNIYNNLRQSGGIFFATTAIAGTGINIPNIDVIILATPIKAKVGVLQAIGRGTRLSKGKKYLEVIDFIDRIPLTSKKVNNSYKWIHKKENIYSNENFINKFYIIDLKISKTPNK